MFVKDIQDGILKIKVKRTHCKGVIFITWDQEKTS